MAELETLRERLSVLRAMLINAVEARDGEGFGGLLHEDQQAYLKHCGDLAVEAATIADSLSPKELRAA